MSFGFDEGSVVIKVRELQRLFTFCHANLTSSDAKNPLCRSMAQASLSGRDKMRLSHRSSRAVRLEPHIGRRKD